jgi:hypothetical protein
MRRRILASVLVLLASLGAVSSVPSAGAVVDALPSRLSDQEFWRLSADLSEDNGYFRSDNLLSNELWFQTVIPELLNRTKAGGVYLGVGPEQNFTYIAALQPKMAFITDIRRGNLHTHLMYKALFELSDDRAEFMARLFTKKRPSGLDGRTSAHDLQQAFWDETRAPTGDADAYKANLEAVYDVLTRKHALPLSKEDREGIDYVYYSFYWYGPAITYNSSSTWSMRGGMATYAALMEATDNDGIARSFLASEDNFRFVKELQRRNLIVPVVGNFGGPKALRSIGAYLRERGATVTAFYLSNVEQYLYQDGLAGNFCANVAAMPLDEASTFIRTQQGGGRSGLMTFLGDMRRDTAGCGGARPLPLR